MTYQDDAPPPPTGPSPERSGRIARIGSRARRGTPFVAGLVAAFLAIALWTALFPGPRPLTTTDVKQNIASALASVTPAPPRAQLVYAAVQPSLVLIEADSLDAAGKSQHGLGTGVVVDLAGDILTALHVVDKSTAIKLTFADGSTSGATIVARQADHDIAVLQPTEPPANIVPATLGNPNAIQIGTDAFIVGNPFGLYGSLSSGVVSGLGRTFQLPDSTVTIKGLIQVDAAVNPGNSGGPLLNRDGQVVGIVTGLVNPTKEDVFIGIGLAVPIDVAGGAAGLPQY